MSGKSWLVTMRLLGLGSLGSKIERWFRAYESNERGVVPAIEAGISSINRPHELRNEAQQ